MKVYVRRSLAQYAISRLLYPEEGRGAAILALYRAMRYGPVKFNTQTTAKVLDALVLAKVEIYDEDGEWVSVEV